MHPALPRRSGTESRFVCLSGRGGETDTGEVLGRARRACPEAMQKLATLEDVIAYLDRAANGGLRTPGRRETVGELKRAIREARDALREISRAP